MQLQLYYLSMSEISRSMCNFTGRTNLLNTIVDEMLFGPYITRKYPAARSLKPKGEEKLYNPQ